MAVEFTLEEWQLLEPAQKTMYKEVMLETCGHLVFLGKDVLLDAVCAPKLRDL